MDNLAGPGIEKVAVRAHENRGVGGLCKMRAVWTVARDKSILIVLK